MRTKSEKIASPPILSSYERQLNDKELLLSVTAGRNLDLVLADIENDPTRIPPLTDKILRRLTATDKPHLTGVTTHEAYLDLAEMIYRKAPEEFFDYRRITALAVNTMLLLWNNDPRKAKNERFLHTLYDDHEGFAIQAQEAVAAARDVLPDMPRSTLKSIRATISKVTGVNLFDTSKPARPQARTGNGKTPSAKYD